MGEIPPYDDFGITHGLCRPCEMEHFDLFEDRALGRSIFLRGIFHQLFDAGRREDMAVAEGIVDAAIAAHCRPVDILIGMIAPMLYEVGEEWKRGALSVASEHRFTAFSERVIDLIARKIEYGFGITRPGMLPQMHATSFVLMNAPGNRHTLAIRILALWLESRGLRARIVGAELSRAALVADLIAARPKYFLMSMSLAEQYDGVADVAQSIHALPAAIRPTVVVGGYPIKAGLISSIPAVSLMADINSLALN
jgi:methanogenic corrinoid protein MtbC1